MAKEQKTSEELMKLLHEKMEGSGLPLGGDGQWLEIIPLEGDMQANWTVSHTPEDPDGNFWKAIERERVGLQEKYDLKDPAVPAS